VDNIYSEKTMRLLTEPLYSSWLGPKTSDETPRTWFASANVGVFASPELPPLVPDVLLSLDVAVNPQAPHDKKHNTYFVWVMGKAPDVVIEVVSNRKGHELSKRKDGYLRMRVAYYVVWDPEGHASTRELSAFMLSGDHYLPMTQADFPSLGGLSLRPWEGTFEGLETRWLRWHLDGQMIPTGKERADAEAARAETEAARAETEAARAETEAARAETEAARAQAAADRADKLAALLRAQGIDPDSL